MTTRDDFKINPDIAPPAPLLIHRFSPANWLRRLPLVIAPFPLILANIAIVLSLTVLNICRELEQKNRKFPKVSDAAWCGDAEGCSRDVTAHPATEQRKHPSCGEARSAITPVWMQLDRAGVKAHFSRVNSRQSTPAGLAANIIVRPLKLPT